MLEFMKVEILTPTEHLLEQLKIIELAGRTAYQSFKDSITVESARKFIGMLLRRGHESVIEHSSMTVRFSGVSRGLTHELVRHRLAAFTQESTRYVDEKGFDFVAPPVIRFGTKPLLDDAVFFMREAYAKLRAAGYPPEDARQILPIGMGNEIVVTANLREWRHIARLRTSKAAHWEIRAAIVKLVEQVRGTLAPLFDEFQPAGTCRSGVTYFVSSCTTLELKEPKPTKE